MSSESITCRCITCGQQVPLDRSPGRTCEACGPILGTTEVLYDLSRVRPDFGRRGDGVFRFAPLLPVPDPGHRLPLLVGDTPLYDAPRLAQRLGIAQVLVKDDGRNPSASLKDRASAMAVAHAVTLGRSVIAAASTGNAASSIALLGAAAGLKVVLFVPAAAPPPKVAQMLLAGALVVRVRGTYDQAFDLCALACERYGWYSRNTATNPVLAEGKKTVALEVAQECSWDPPGLVAVAVGDGCILAAIHKGFKELYALGLTARVPRLVGVQAQGCAPLARAHDRGETTVKPVFEPETYADSIRVGIPRDQVKALRAVSESKGYLLAVPDDLIREAQRLLSREAGVLAEPAGAAGFAGLLHLAATGLLSRDDRAVVIVSGHALKDVTGAMSAVVEQPLEIEAEPSALDGVLESAVSVCTSSPMERS